jgi:hypothetical protein
VTLDDGNRLVVEFPDGLQADGGDLVGQRVGADHQHTCVGG